MRVSWIHTLRNRVFLLKWIVSDLHELSCVSKTATRLHWTWIVFWKMINFLSKQVVLSASTDVETKSMHPASHMWSFIHQFAREPHPSAAWTVSQLGAQEFVSTVRWIMIGLSLGRLDFSMHKAQISCLWSKQTIQVYDLWCWELEPAVTPTPHKRDSDLGESPT